MVSDQECSCEDRSTCGGRLTLTEILMNKMDPRETAQRYHEIMRLFEEAFDRAEEQGW